MRDRIKGSLSDVDLTSTGGRDAFQSLLQRASVGIAGMGRCSDTDVTWLARMFAPDLAGPSGIVVTPLSLERLQRLRRIDSGRFHVVWAEEAPDRLHHVLGQIDPWHQDPLRALGRRLVRDHSLHRSLVQAIQHVCKLSAEPDPGPPVASVTELARRADIPPDPFRRYWRDQMPLRCPPKRLLSWAILLWAVRQRPKSTWSAIADEVGVRRRTLERHAVALAGCTLAAAGHSPARVRSRFQEWVAEVSR